ncbi:PEP/pyruvate-binding domain-containing protein [Arthrobacter sp. AFG20]|uniref:PEP/pyruvate-binding domain-containing protein n=1 Tax=Arthrobacter sp. AFG20 TaxID=1688671 RepID=UPI0021557D80|nr:PEP/pyruvate-binding domain-containing protein [Arthrobacter sp. AFG20]
MTYIKDFDQLGRSDVDEAGGKGANLGELARAGFPVPQGFVLTTPAYQDFVNATGIAGRILELAALPAAASNDDYEAAARQIRSLFTESTMPDEIGVEISAAYGRLSHQTAALGEEDGAESSGDYAARVAVRSSATAEDLASASFAGQQDTYLNVSGPEAVAAAVIDCWASLWNARAMAYRSGKGFDSATLSLAVVIQEMVDAGAAGVLFTANPATGRRDQVVISAAWGLGESVVSGAVTTDDVIVDAATGRVGQRRTADKDVMTVYDGTGTREQPVPEDKRRAPVLDDDAAAALARQGTAIAQHFGEPQDIEWAQAAGDFFILQARPITALPEPSADAPTEWPLPYPNGMYFRASIVEQLPDPLSPLFADLIDGSVTRSLNALLAEAVGNSNVVRPGDVSLPTVNGYAYYYYSNAGMRRVMGKSLTAMRALAQGKAHMGIKGWRDHSHPKYRGLVKYWAPNRRRTVLLPNCWRAFPRCWTRARRITPLCSPSSPSPQPAKSCSGATTTSSSGGPATRPRRSSCSVTTANPSARRNPCMTWRCGPAKGRSLPRPSRRDQRPALPKLSAAARLRRVWTRAGTGLRAWIRTSGTSGVPASSSTWPGTGMPSTTWTSSTLCRPMTPLPCSRP